MSRHEKKEPQIKWQAKPDLNAAGQCSVHDVYIDPNGRVNGRGGIDMDPVGRTSVQVRSTRRSPRNRSM